VHGQTLVHACESRYLSLLQRLLLRLFVLMAVQATLLGVALMA